MIDELGAPIKYCRKARGYIYTEDFELSSNLMLSLEEFNKLKLGFRAISQFKHLEVFRDFEAIFYKIEQAFKFKSTINKRSHIDFEKTPYYKGTEHIDIFLEAIELTKAVQFDYQTFNANTALRHLLHPYVIKEYANRWYIIGYLPKENSITTYALDRIIGMPKCLEQFFDVSKDFDIKKHFQYTYGVTAYQNKPIEKVILKFNSTQAKYFKSKPFHTYKLLEEKQDGTLIVEIELRPNYELTRKIVSMGKGVKVLQPQSLIEDVKKYLQDALEQYQ